MKQLLDIPAYTYDLYKYRNINKNLFWYKKNKGLHWINGQNFGDYLSLIIIGEIAHKSKRYNFLKQFAKQQLLGLGSVLHFAKDGDIVWGSGINGKIDSSKHEFNHLDVRLVRGPKTKAFLEQRSIPVDNIFGDPGLLLPTLYPDLDHAPVSGKITVIPNVNEISLCKRAVPNSMVFVSPMNYWKKVVYEILSSELILTSSLHGVVIAEAFGVPVRFLMPIGGETLFKYQDYYQGTGRQLSEQPSTFKDKVTPKSGIAMPPSKFDAQAMLDAFPIDLFE